MNCNFERKKKIVYCTPSLYIAGGLERVLTLKANYFAGHYGYDITIILTEGKGKPLFYPLSPKVNVINLDIDFEDLWTSSFVKKVFVYLRKQRLFKKKLTAELMRIRPDITISLLRREVNFLTKIKDGSKKVGELHVNRSNYRNFEEVDSNVFKHLFAKFWMQRLIKHLRRLDCFVVLTEEDKRQWSEVDDVIVIPDPLSFEVDRVSSLDSKRLIAVGRYVYQKGFDLLLKSWSMIENQCLGWELVIYGQGDREPYERLIDELKIDRNRCHLYGPSKDIKQEYLKSSLFIFSSRFEGFGMVLVEAMACGIPVVSFDCPCGPKDIVTEGKDGFLVPNGDTSKLASTIKLLVTHPDKIQEMSLNAISKSQNYSMEKVSLRWKQLFDSLMRNDD